MPSYSLSANETEIVARLNKESDRAAAIISACILEDRIEAAIKAKLRNDEKRESDLFGLMRPLGWFGAKNDLAFLLRCYGTRLYSELTTINNIRNAFAHYYLRKGQKIHDFNSPYIADLCKQLTLLEGYVLTMDEFDRRFEARKSIAEIPGGTMAARDISKILDDPRERFSTTVGLFTIHLGIYPTEDSYIQLIGDEPKPSLSRRP